MDPKIPIVYCFDEDYAAYAAVSILSAFQNCSSPILVYCITNSNNDETLKPLANLKELYSIDIKIIKNDGEIFSTWKEFFHISKATYLRLLIPSLIPCKKVIYLDCDTLVLGDISKLFEIDLGLRAVGGVYDPRGSKSSILTRVSNDTYINAGVLVMDLEMLRKMQFLEKCITLQSKDEKSIIWQDQCIINKVLESNKSAVPREWNLQIFPPEIHLNEWNHILNDQPSILHFIGPVKPWMEWCNPEISSIWLDYAKSILKPEQLKINISEVKHVLYLLGSLERNGMVEDAALLKISYKNMLDSINQ
jgi:lipopolysaccharide biosynthesis glycosyltransferase